MADLDSGLFGIALSDPEDDSAPEAAEPTSSTTTTSASKAARVAQSEDEFLAVKQGYTVKVENGELWRDIRLPLGQHVTKQEAQALLHAVEELYFLKRYAEGAAFVSRALGDEGRAEAGGLDRDIQKLLMYYKEKCIKAAERV
ncbi:hypothetical protein JX265_006861 [Neoarthrinium moseri]|uniref:Uncharacterized protein n=1 Tax=Neoarthrinium moseri TaxID=1658444 RepID=A0A9Q0AQE1_9PEZI|nr:hypothetical protein JX265_006861 [Neoarthrinium moseri]